MPELLEVESYRALAEARALGRRVAAVVSDDHWYLKGNTTAPALAIALAGRTLVAARRRGKLLLLDISDDGPVLGLRFGMTGRLVVDDHAGVERLIYSPVAPRARFDRFVINFDDGGDLRISDPRRLGGVELDPDEHGLGPDAVTMTLAELRRALRDGREAIKARLLDQRRVAGIGNLLGDEILWRAGLAPQRPAGSLNAADLRRLHRHLRITLTELGGRGGSHTGDLMAQRHPGGVCPADGAPLRRATVGGRTSWWCPHHQH